MPVENSQRAAMMWKRWDLIQAVMGHVCRRRRGDDPEGPLNDLLDRLGLDFPTEGGEAELERFVHRLADNYWRRHSQRRHVPLDPAWEPESSDDSPDEAAIWADQCDKALRGLKADDREFLLDYSGISRAKAAAGCFTECRGMTEAACRKKYWRIISRVRMIHGQTSEKRLRDAG